MEIVREHGTRFWGIVLHPVRNFHILRALYVGKTYIRPVAHSLVCSGPQLNVRLQVRYAYAYYTPFGVFTGSSRKQWNSVRRRTYFIYLWHLNLTYGMPYNGGFETACMMEGLLSFLLLQPNDPPSGCECDCPDTFLNCGDFGFDCVDPNSACYIYGKLRNDDDFVLSNCRPLRPLMVCWYEPERVRLAGCIQRRLAAFFLDHDMSYSVPCMVLNSSREIYICRVAKSRDTWSANAAPFKYHSAHSSSNTCSHAR